jgi:YHS domain-containing protein
MVASIAVVVTQHVHDYVFTPSRVSEFSGQLLRFPSCKTLADHPSTIMNALGKTGGGSPGQAEIEQYLPEGAGAWEAYTSHQKGGGVMAKDPVCGMQVETTKAAGTSEYEGHTYVFCSAACQQKFDSNPAQYTTK